MIIAVALSVVFHTGILRVYRMVENAIYGRMQLQGPQEVNRTLARVGSVGEIKLTKNVLWHVAHESGPAPAYLYEATYDGFDPVQNAWLNSRRDNRKFDRVPSTGDIRPPDQWTFGGTGPATTRLRVRGEISEEFAILPLPDNAAFIQSLPAYRLDRNGLGVVRADLARPVVHMSVTGTADAALRPPPDLSVDLDLGRALPVVRRTVEELGLSGLPPSEAIQRIREFFASDFTYTLKAGKLSMRAFLESERRGHCEYFASATVLLLRAAGIPARYHTGFALVELDSRTRQWKVRGTHGHAWATAWLDGQWQVVDTTPPDWLAQDSEGIDFWQNVLDWWEEKRLTFQEWRTSRDAGGLLAWLAPTLAALVVVYTLVRILLRRKKKRAERVEPVNELPEYTSLGKAVALVAIAPDHRKGAGETSGKPAGPRMGARIRGLAARPARASRRARARPLPPPLRDQGKRCPARRPRPRPGRRNRARTPAGSLSRAEGRNDPRQRVFRRCPERPGGVWFAPRHDTDRTIPRFPARCPRPFRPLWWHVCPGDPHGRLAGTGNRLCRSTARPRLPSRIGFVAP
jgi:transglutaminase-like putative cysteine protease